MAILTMTAGLLFILIFHIGFLTYRLSIGNLGLGKLYLDLVFILQTACHNVQMLVTHAIDKGLMVFRVVHKNQCPILIRHFLQGLGNLVNISLIRRLITLCGIGLGKLGLRIRYRICLCREGISCLCSCQLCQRTQIPCMKLTHLYRLVALQYIELTYFCLYVTVAVVHHIIRLQNTGAYLYQRIFADKRIHHCLINISRLRFCEIIVCLEDTVCL